MKEYFCICEADCIHKKGIYKTTMKTQEGKTTVKYDKCNNTGKRCNCPYRRRIGAKIWTR
jgi:hypothetical protein